MLVRSSSDCLLSDADHVKTLSKISIALCSVSRNALCGAYDLLNIDDSGITFEHFILFMEEYQPERGT